MDNEKENPVAVTTEDKEILPIPQETLDWLESVGAEKIPDTLEITFKNLDKKEFPHDFNYLVRVGNTLEHCMLYSEEYLAHTPLNELKEKLERHISYFK
ncbi:hypothetical protein FACS189490_12190 [Clostridia bacterium]|nr:hypothetical protein FACS189490_12190 [Clostridia bacterium]